MGLLHGIRSMATQMMEVATVCSEILINPAGTAECLLGASQRISAGAIFSIATGKKFRTTGGLIIAR